MPLDQLWGQLTIAGAALGLLVFIWRSYAGYVSRQLAEQRASHEREIGRLTAVWEARVADAHKRAEAWETAAVRFQAAHAEVNGQIGELLPLAQTTVGLLRALGKDHG